MNKKYIPCKVCNCEDCRIGTYRESWYCPRLKKQICDVCCIFDMREDEDKCLEIKCKLWENRR